ncbi:uncharacterized protein LOC111007509, partial [Momordica charantia]|uniref:Uncharacterized protein LOC111007509 n=1 Tax=Momordica charantia TaxID=3673 RepID=A0A6J1C346_MOMCH
LNSGSYSSSITVDRSKDLPSHHCPDAVQTVWTDEKHRSYLDSLEASFVQELHQYRHLRASTSKQKTRRKQITPNISSSEVRQYSHSKSGRKQCNLEAPDLLEECGSYSDRRHLRYMANPCGFARSSQQISTRSGDSVAILTEVSDQNFVDNHPGELSGGISNAKRLKRATTDSSSNNQVKLLFGKLTIASYELSETEFTAI